MEQQSPTPGGAESLVVVVNHEGQYSTWWADRAPPAGWSATGAAGTRDQCLAHIAEVWTDMRPLSLRERMEDAASWE